VLVFPAPPRSTPREARPTGSLFGADPRDPRQIVVRVDPRDPRRIVGPRRSARSAVPVIGGIRVIRGKMRIA
jgi:hypothetical protein